MWQYGGGNNQQWRAGQVGTDTYRFVSRHSGKCLDVPGASTDDVQLVQYTCNGTNDQLFRLTSTPDTGQPDFGPNVLIFDPSMPASTIQARLNEVFRQQNVFVPALRSNTNGTTWASGNQQGTNIPLSQFFVAKPGTSAATINQQLTAGRHLLLTPGIHQVNEPIRVTRPDTVVMGLGLATVMPTNGNMALDVADADGVKIAGLLIDAAPTNSPLLMQVGAPGSTARHQANPTSVHDLYVRIGGSAVGQATTSLVVNSHDVIGDHLWLWRGDHSIGRAVRRQPDRLRLTWPITRDVPLSGFEPSVPMLQCA